MCKYCHSDKVISAFDSDKIDSWDAVEYSILDYDETGEGNSCIMLFGDGVLYDFMIPEQVKRLPFNYCPMCGKPLGDTPQDEDTIYFVQDFNYDDGYYPAYLDKEDAIDHAEGVIGSDDTRECRVLTARVIKKDTCKLAITWD